MRLYITCESILCLTDNHSYITREGRVHRCNGNILEVEKWNKVGVPKKEGWNMTDSNIFEQTSSSTEGENMVPSDLYIVPGKMS